MNLLHKHPLKIGTAILLAGFLFARLPYFLWYQVPEFAPDTFGYFHLAQQLEQHNLPLVNALDPIGFPVFIWLSGYLGQSIAALVLIQNLVTLLCCFVLVYSITKRFQLTGLLTAVALTIHVMDPYTIRMDTELLTESIYTNSLIVLCALLMNSLLSKHLFHWMTLSVWLMAPALIRSNGIYVYVIWAALLFYQIRFGFSKKWLLAFATPFIIANIGWCIWNYKTEGVLLPGNPSRIISVFKFEQNQTFYATLNADPQGPPADYLTNKIFALKHYWNHVAINKANVYDVDIPRRQRELLVNRTWQNTPQRWNLYQPKSQQYRPIAADKSLMDFTLREYRSPDYNYTGPFSPSAFSTGWLTMYRHYYVLHDLLFWSPVWPILMVFCLAAGLWFLFRSRWRSPYGWLITLFVFLHVGGMLVITFTHGRYQSRYIHVTEFLYYLTPVLALLPLINKKAHKYV